MVMKWRQILNGHKLLLEYGEAGTRKFNVRSIFVRSLEAGNDWCDHDNWSPAVTLIGVSKLGVRIWILVKPCLCAFACVIRASQANTSKLLKGFQVRIPETTTNGKLVH